ncbi:MAG TPA: hypothetical protein VES67_09905 [Vicinamibacterales bacterium]|nr:hypothetical protein [Vicinamibacterales bacterium]
MSTCVRRVCLAACLAGLPFSAVLLAGPQQSASAASERRLVFPKGRASGLNGSYWQAALANGGPAPRHERLLVVMPDGLVLGVVDGERDRVMLPIDLTRELSERELQALLVHNHPSCVSLSRSDLMHLAKIGVAGVVAVGSDGTVFEASAAPRYDPDLFAERLYPQLKNRVQERLATEASRDRVDLAMLDPHLAHLVAVVLHRARVIDYRVTPSVTAGLAHTRFRDLFERVIGPEVRRLELELPAPTSPAPPGKPFGRRQ